MVLTSNLALIFSWAILIFSIISSIFLYSAGCQTLMSEDTDTSRCNGMDLHQQVGMPNAFVSSNWDTKPIIICTLSLVTTNSTEVLPWPFGHKEWHDITILEPIFIICFFCRLNSGMHSDSSMSCTLVHEYSIFCVMSIQYDLLCPVEATSWLRCFLIVEILLVHKHFVSLQCLIFKWVTVTSIEANLYLKTSHQCPDSSLSSPSSI